MPETGHVYASVAAPGTTIVLALEYSVAVDVFEILAGENVVEANAEFAACVDPNNLPAEIVTMINATPGYLEDLSDQLELILNNVALADVCRFIEAMQSAGTPHEIGEVAWDEIERVYDNVTNPTYPNSNEVTCIVIDVGTPGSGAPPADPLR